MTIYQSKFLSMSQNNLEAEVNGSSITNYLNSMNIWTGIRTISPPDNIPRTISPRTISPQDKIPPDNIPPFQYPPGQYPPVPISPWTISPWTKSPRMISLVKTCFSKKNIYNSSVLNYPKTCVGKLFYLFYFF